MEAIQCPILKVRGSASTTVSDEAIERMKRVGKQFSSVDVEGPGHVVAADRPQTLIEVTRAFLGIPA